MTTHTIHGDAVNHVRMNRRCDVATTATATATVAVAAVAAHATVRPISMRTWHTWVERGGFGVKQSARVAWLAATSGGKDVCKVQVNACTDA